MSRSEAEIEAERTFSTMEEVRREFFPNLCPHCGGDEFRQDFTRILDPRARICRSCRRPSEAPATNKSEDR